VLCFWYNASQSSLQCGSQSKSQNFFDGRPLRLSDLTQGSVQSLLRILDMEVEITKKLSVLLILAPGSLLGERQLFLLLGSLANDGNVPLAECQSL
jgi:hypothetical protein